MSSAKRLRTSWLARSVYSGTSFVPLSCVVLRWVQPLQGV